MVVIQWNRIYAVFHIVLQDEIQQRAPSDCFGILLINKDRIILNYFTLSGLEKN